MEGYVRGGEENRAPGDYPPVQPGGRNRRYAEAMLDNVGGGNSEMGAVSLYFYDHLVTAGLPEVARVFHEISVVEMHHLEIFGALAYQMGEDPRLWGFPQGGRRCWWSPNYNQYYRNLGQLIRYAVKEEKATIRKYKAQARWMNDPNIVLNLRRIIEDEEQHIRVFGQLYDTYVGQTGGQ